MKVFLIGATGYIGGDILHAIATSSSLEISCLVRGKDKAAAVSVTFPFVRIVQGDLDDSALIEKESEAADVVLNFTSTKHLVSAKAIESGLKQRKAGAGYWIQIGGASVLFPGNIASLPVGEPPQHSYDDVADAEEVLSIIRKHPERVENLVSSIGSDEAKTAVLICPLIYGQGRGPVNQRSMQANDIAKSTLTRGRGVVTGQGLNNWSNVNVADISELVLMLLKAAAKGQDGLWNKDGIYLVESGQMTFGDLGKRIAKAAFDQGLIKSSTDIETIDAKTADSLTDRGAILWGTNAVIKSTKAPRALGWAAKAPSLEDSVADIVAGEAR